MVDGVVRTVGMLRWIQRPVATVLCLHSRHLEQWQTFLLGDDEGLSSAVDQLWPSSVGFQGPLLAERMIFFVGFQGPRHFLDKKVRVGNEAFAPNVGGFGRQTFNGSG